MTKSLWVGKSKIWTSEWNFGFKRKDVSSETPSSSTRTPGTGQAWVNEKIRNGMFNPTSLLLLPIQRGTLQGCRTTPGGRRDPQRRHNICRVRSRKSQAPPWPRRVTCRRLDLLDDTYGEENERESVEGRSPSGTLWVRPSEFTEPFWLEGVRKDGETGRGVVTFGSRRSGVESCQLEARWSFNCR